MKKYLNIFLLFLFTILSCDTPTKSSMSEKDYKNASLHMGKHFLKYLNNILISQEWDDEFLHYKLKKKNGSDSFTINLNSLEKTIYSENKTFETKRSKFSKKK
jgi:hypothetical protein